MNERWIDTDRCVEVSSVNKTFSEADIICISFTSFLVVLHVINIDPVVLKSEYLDMLLHGINDDIFNFLRYFFHFSFRMSN